MFPKEKYILRIALVVLLPATAIGLFFVFDYGIQEIDYASGHIRTKHYILNHWYRTTDEDGVWIESHIDRNQYPQNWHLLWYTDTPFAPQINSKGGKIIFQIHQLNRFLTRAQANQESKKLVAQFIIDQLNQPGKNEIDIFVRADRSFDCFFDTLPFPEGPTDELTTEEVRETIRQCSAPVAPPTISP